MTPLIFAFQFITHVKRLPGLPLNYYLRSHTSPAHSLRVKADKLIHLWKRFVRDMTSPTRMPPHPNQLADWLVAANQTILSNPILNHASRNRAAVRLESLLGAWVSARAARGCASGSPGVSRQQAKHHGYDLVRYLTSIARALSRCAHGCACHV